MTITNISEDLKVILERISGMCFKAESILNLCIDGFMKHKIDLVDSAQEQTMSIGKEGNQLRKLLSNKAAERTANKEQVKSLLATLSSIGLAINGLDSISRHVRFKICEKILFSDKGLDEIRYLFNATRDILKTAGDTIATKNEVFMKYVVDKSLNLEKLAVHYEEKHEERLITGECLPEASPVYVNIVEWGMHLITPTPIYCIFECGLYTTYATRCRQVHTPLIVDSILTVVWHIKKSVTRLFGQW